jgi:Xaa-Pro aminopeptidase
VANRTNESEKKQSKVQRLRELRTYIVQKELDALLISQPENIRYLSGFTGSSGWLLVSQQESILATDFRYVEQAKGESPDFEISQIKGEPAGWLPCMGSDLGYHRLGFEAGVVSYDGYHKLDEAIKDSRIDLELIPTTGMVEELRSIKDPEELQSITKAVELADAAF